MIRPSVVPLLGLGLALLLAGCGSSAPRTPKIDALRGDQVARMAERQLEAEHPGVAPGEIDCADLPFEVGASVRCTRVSELSGGRRVMLYATVAVTSEDDGGRLHVTTDDTVAEFGVTADRVRADVASWIGRRRGGAAVVTCPYLPGKPGASIRCVAQAGARRDHVRVSVTSVDPATYTTRFRCSWEKSGGREG